MRITIALILVCAGLLAAGLPVVAETVEDGVYVYTNHDLLRMFGPPEKAPASPQAEVDEGGWDYVIDFIERQRAKLESQRDHELDRVRTDAEAGSWMRPNRGRHVVGSYPWLVGVDRRRARIGGNGHRDPSRGRGEAESGGPQYVSPSKGPAGRITPIHARRPLR